MTKLLSAVCVYVCVTYTDPHPMIYLGIWLPANGLAMPPRPPGVGADAHAHTAKEFFS